MILNKVIFKQILNFIKNMYKIYKESNVSIIPAQIIEFNKHIFLNAKKTSINRTSEIIVHNIEEVIDIIFSIRQTKLNISPYLDGIITSVVLVTDGHFDPIIELHTFNNTIFLKNNYIIIKNSHILYNLLSFLEKNKKKQITKLLLIRSYYNDGECIENNIVIHLHKKYITCGELVYHYNRFLNSNKIIDKYFNKLPKNIKDTYKDKSDIPKYILSINKKIVMINNNEIEINISNLIKTNTSNKFISDNFEEMNLFIILYKHRLSGEITISEIIPFLDPTKQLDKLEIDTIYGIYKEKLYINKDTGYWYLFTKPIKIN